MILQTIFKRVLREGSVTLIDHDGRRHTFGGSPIVTSTTTGPAPGPVTLRITDPRFARRFLAGPEMAIGEAYMDGTLILEEGSIYDLVATLIHNVYRHSRRTAFFRLHWALNRALRWFHQYNPIERAERNVAHHYNLSAEMYRLFLDGDRQYSCAYWPPGIETLEDAQRAKKRHIAAKLRLEPGQSVLDVGCGWGGLALHLAREHDVHVTGITLSSEQFHVAQERAKAEGLADRVTFRLQDYRHVTETFDRIVSVGMFEHVGVNHYRDFFEATRARLKEDGIFLLHTIGRAEPPGGTNAWLRKYIFPGGYTPALSELSAAVERADWIPTDVEVLRVHYAETLRHWRARFEAQRERIVTQLYDARFYRMWMFYLAGCEAVFRFDRQVVFQMQMTRSLDAAPITRDYITDAERAANAAAADAAERPAPTLVRRVG
ncbi:class I SAM-dependent methyltransferase [Roseospira marina]|uniref:Class I SAM-dependent methyltransferase n=1 Tax=Roseospira marina TaxID=140057 RepID=A0A5M6IB92_9PROT|nr:cyclopropane-fatty-acyl-phospholipid synthase family protein [Roseospira marina]KAA5604888.1 class I SAM-dependent methyltransferase [Roseospira marina]MBB4315227.1 cyclopropane-fatty-acyl-phospholipid synthase [Roseospira marina]MBB5088227.1 cyclopropane-fatty-acyl-phospholipid synthase [Roseospira marina]